MSSSSFALRLATEPVVDFTLEQLAREGARRALQKAIEDEVADYIEANKHCVDESGHRQVVRNGRHQPRRILSGVGPIEVHQPRVDDRRVGEDGVRFRFTSKILPRYLRKTKAIEDLVPWLYLKGISTGEMPDALVHLGFDGSGLSPTSVVRMLQAWHGEYEDWTKRDLSGKQYVYIWADGLYFGCRLSDDRPCLLVIMGATADGKKELIAIIDGQRESETSWTALLLDCKSRGLTIPPKLAMGDGSLGFWIALSKIFPSTRHQRCWVHKTMNVLDKLPKNQQPAAKTMLHEIWMAATRADATKAFERFVGCTERSGRGRRIVLRRIGPSCWRSTTFPRSTGSTSEPATRSKAPSRPCVCGPIAPKALARVRRESRWHSSWRGKRNHAGEN